MPDQRVEKGSTTQLEDVDGGLTVGRGARITPAKGRLVAVSGAVYFEGDAEVDCDFSCDSLDVKRGQLRVDGDLTVAKAMDVAHTLKVSGTLRAGEIEVGGKLFATSVSCGGMARVGGIVEVTDTFEAESIDVGGKVMIGGAVKLKDLGVGGLAKIGGGSITGSAKVGGVFESTGPLEFGDLQVWGKCTLPAGCRGRKIATSGKLTVKGDMECEKVDVGGVAEMRGNLKAQLVTINGKLEVEGSLSATETLDNFGAGEVRADFQGHELHVGGRFKARKILLDDQAEVAGEVETDKGMKARSIVIGSGSKCRGPLVAELVELSKSKMAMADRDAHFMGQVVSMRLIGRMTNAEDVYGDHVILGPNTRCRNIFAKTVELGPGCVVEHVTYTDELRVGHHAVHLTRPSDKVEKLPPFPL